MVYDSPCLTCTRVRDPGNCENKLCKDWQPWFIRRWDAMRKAVHDRIRSTPLQEAGVPLAGQRYASPHRVREFLKMNPCGSCQSPKDLCRTPCPTRVAWDTLRNEVNHELES